MIYSKYVGLPYYKTPWEICRAVFLLYQKQMFIAVVEKNRLSVCFSKILYSGPEATLRGSHKTFLGLSGF